MTPGYVEFEFDLPEALLARLIKTLNKMSGASLAPANLVGIPEVQGVYQLLLDNDLIYIGKTDAKAGLRKRLERHSRKIQMRRGLDPARVTFKAVRIYVFTAIDLEKQLLKNYGGTPVVRWNGSGFGSNDPGKKRDRTTYKKNHFDIVFPIDIDLPLSFSLVSEKSASDILNSLKDALPFLLRFEQIETKPKTPHFDLSRTAIVFETERLWTARTLIEHIVAQLPAGWQAIKLPSHMILYKEDQAYPQGEVIARSR
ncbi:MAG: GIY-YIG nuclease family protein [Alphaproteobacteria bacterium]